MPIHAEPWRASAHEAAPQPQRHRLLAWSLALLVGALGTWLVHRHQFASGFDLFPGPRGDTRLVAYLCEHWYQALRRQTELLSPLMFYPVKGTLGYSDAMLLFVPPYSMLRAVGLDIFTSLAVVVVVFSFLNFVAGFALLFSALRFRWLPSLAGAMFFAFNNPKLAHADHLQLQPVWLLAVVAAGVIVFVRDVRAPDTRRTFGLLALAGLALDLQLLTGFYLGWFLILWSGLLLTLTACVRQTREGLLRALRLHWRPMLGAAAVTAAGLVPFLIIYLPVSRQVGGWPYEMVIDFIPSPRAYLWMADGNFVWSRVTAATLHAVGAVGGWMGVVEWERRLGLGVVAASTWLALSVWALAARTRRPFLFVAILSVNLLMILALQYHGHSLWRAVYELVPGARSIRAVSRFIIVAALPMSIAFAFAAEQTQQWIGRRAGLNVMFSALIAFGLFEQFNRGDGQYYSIRSENERLQRLAAKLPGDCTAFYVALPSVRERPEKSFRGPKWEPQQDVQWMHDAMLVSILLGVPTLNGRSGKSPPGWRLGEIRASDYESEVQKWVASHNLDRDLCRLEMDE
jgi:hypothetical protein